MSRSHYDTLGLPKDAPPEAVKRAFRRKASQAHPDKLGGDADRMAAINRAWETLGNTQKRLEYDRTGVDEPASSIDEQVRDLLLSLFTQALDTDEPDLLKFARVQLANQLELATAHAQDCKMKMRKLTKRRARVKVKGDTNLVHLIIDRKLEELTARIAFVEKNTGLFTAARAIAATYVEEFDWDDLPPASFSPSALQYFRGR